MNKDELPHVQIPTWKVHRWEEDDDLSSNVVRMSIPGMGFAGNCFVSRDSEENLSLRTNAGSVEHGRPVRIWNPPNILRGGLPKFTIEENYFRFDLNDDSGNVPSTHIDPPTSKEESLGGGLEVAESVSSDETLYSLHKSDNGFLELRQSKCVGLNHYGQLLIDATDRWVPRGWAGSPVVNEDKQVVAALSGGLWRRDIANLMTDYTD